MWLSFSEALYDVIKCVVHEFEDGGGNKNFDITYLCRFGLIYRNIAKISFDQQSAL